MSFLKKYNQNIMSMKESAFPIGKEKEMPVLVDNSS
jgi:hypothetical protein